MAQVASNLPTTFKRLIGDKLTSNFREATHIEVIKTADLIQSLKNDQVVVKVYYAGIQASDVNYVAGRYDPTIKLPYVTGMEGLGEIVAVGSAVKNTKLGAIVATTAIGSFSEYYAVREKEVFVLPGLHKEILGLIGSGLTSSLALEHAHMRNGGETVLVTAAAGGAGQIAVQLAKIAGNHVIGTCSSDVKVAALKALGCDRVINYNKENLATVLREEYPKGLDLVFENVGGETFQIALRNLAPKGRILVIGGVSTYANESVANKSRMTEVWQDSVKTVQLLAKSQAVIGFMVSYHMADAPRHLQQMIKLMSEGKLKVNVDGDQFRGLESVADAVEYMHKGKNTGKLMVTISEPPKKSKL